MTSLIPNSAFDRIFNATLFGHFGSVKQVYPNRSRRSRTRLCTRTGRKDRRGKLLEQLDVCYEELSAAIMAELEDRERVNQELREKAHQKLDVAKELLHNFQGQLALKNNCNAQYSKFAGLISDRNKRFKSDTLRTLIEHVEILIKKLEPKHDTAEARTPDLSASSSSTPRVVATPCASPVIPPQKVDPPPETSKETLTENATTVDDPPKVDTPPVAKNVPAIAVPPKVTVPLAENKIPVDVSPAKVFTSTVEKDVGKVSQSNQQTETPVPAREIISEVAKSKQQPQIPWRTPTRLEPVKVEKKEKEKKSSVSFVEPLKDKEPERLARRYATKTKKRPAEDQPFMESQFKKPFPMGEQQNQPQKPLFQRRHQLPAPVYNSRDPRTYGEHCQRRVMQMQNRTRFESQNQQYYKQRPHMTPGPVVRPQTATAFPFVVPAPVPPTRPAPVLPTRPAPIVRPPAPRASVPPTFTKQAAVPSVSTPVVRPDIKRTINPVYSNDELIPLGKKELPKKGVAPSQTVPIPEKPKEDVPAKVDDIEVTEPKVVDVKITEPKAAEQVDEPKKADEKDKLLDQNLMEMLKEIGDEAKIKKILDVMNKKSDDEAEEEKSNAKEGAKTAKDKSAEKKTKKYKRIRSKVDESSSEEEPSKKEETKKPKAKPAKRVSGGCREVVHLLENMNDWMGRGQELHHTRRRGTTNAQTLQNVSPTTKAQSSVPKDGGTISSSDEESLPVAAKKHPVAEEESLLTVTGSPPAKGKSKKKEANFVYNDKKSVHCNSSYSSNCALCSFNGSAIVDHYVYEHKKYEVFISRISQKMADIIRADPFVTNGILLTGEGGVEKISFKCYFCLASKELTSAKWTEHLASHTGEYRFRCTSCPVMSQTEELESTFFHEKTCLKPSLAIYNNIEFQDNHLYGFICDACNYIQIRRVNMERHLKREHPSADVTCSRFSIVNHKVETKPIIDEEQMMADMLSARSQTPTVLIPFQAKAEPQDACEIVNQPFTEDEDMLEQESLATPAQLMRRTDIRLESIHIGSAGVANQLGHRPFSFKMEQELQGDQISSSAAFYESPMSPEPASMEENLSEAQAVIPVLQIQSVQGGFDMSKVFFKHEKDDGDYDSDASDKTTDFNMSDASEEGRQVAQNTSEGEKKNAGGSNGEGTGSESSSANGSGVEPSSGSGSATGGGAAGSGGDDGDDRKKEEFPLPFKIKVEKDGENEEKKEENESLTSNLGNVVIKSEKRDEDPDDPPKAEGEYDFVELVLDSTRIEHVAFIEYQSEILFLCLMPGCQYITKKSGDISKHLSKKHGQVQWDGYCHPCQSQISILDNCSITNELQHLLDIHARRKTPTLEITDVRSTTSNVIRIRKMPGDTLSAGEINPPPLAPLISPVTTNMVAGPSTVTFGQSPMIIQSAATIQAMPVGGNTMITPTHTIPAQIRPVMHKTATTIAPASSPPSLTHPAGGASIPSLAGLRINTVRLKPWTNMVTTKNQEHCRSMLEEISLLCLYKCMARSCAFTTSNRYFMEQHLTLHENIHTGGPNAPRKCWLECAYCDLIAPNNIVLLTHIDGEHASCGFQCNLCFYRSRDPTNVVVHQKTYHPTGNIPKNILIMPENLKSFGDDEWKAMQESLRKNVLPLYCTSKYLDYLELMVLFGLVRVDDNNFLPSNV